MGRQHDEDPLTLAIQPPPNESAEQRKTRLQAEDIARKISNDIDEELKQEKAALKKKPPVKVLLLGQSESGEYLRCTTCYLHSIMLMIASVGKSTTLKSEFRGNFGHL